MLTLGKKKDLAGPIFVKIAKKTLVFLVQSLKAYCRPNCKEVTGVIIVWESHQKRCHFVELDLVQLTKDPFA
jgi:hypothetical protein